MGIWVIIFCAAVWITVYHLAEAETKREQEEEQRRRARAAEEVRQLKALQKAQEHIRKAAEKEAKERAKAAQKAIEEAKRADANRPKIEDLARVLEAKTNLALALENAAGKETDPVKKAAMHERAARTYAQAHTISEKIDKLMEGKL